VEWVPEGDVQSIPQVEVEGYTQGRLM
jgi:hypothetical protein